MSVSYVFKKLSRDIETYIFFFAFAIVLILSSPNFLVFHSIAEGFAVIVSFSFFIFSWNFRKYSNSPYFTHLGIAFFFVAILDGLHLMSYKGMGIFYFENAVNPPTQFWVAARFLQSSAFLIAAIMNRKVTHMLWPWLIYFTYSAASTYAIFNNAYPDCMLPDTGLTNFKIYSEYLISTIFLIGAVTVIRSKSLTDRNSKIILAMSLLIMFGTEYIFTRYNHVYDWINHTGHIFKVISFYLLYKSAIYNNLESPMTRLFSSLNDEKNKLHNKNQDLDRQLSNQISQLSLYKMAIENTAAVTTTDTSGRITDMNRMFCELSKYNRDELLQNSYKVVNSGCHSKEFFEEMWKTVSSGQAWKGEVKNKTKDGDDFWLFMSISPIYSAVGKIEGYISIGHDITELKNNRDQIQNLQKMSAVGALSAEILHDTMNPLAIIDGKARILVKTLETADKEQIKNNLEKISQSVTRIKELFQIIRGNLLISSEKNPEPVQDLSNIILHELINKAISFCHDDERYAGCNMNVENSVSKDIIIYGSQAQLLQVFVNLFSNSCDALSTHNNSDRWIKITSDNLEDKFLIRVTDGGSGIPAEIRHKIFEPLYTTKKGSNGTGLGLDICKNIIVSHGGLIEVNPNSPNTQFEISFPKPVI